MQTHRRLTALEQRAAISAVRWRRVVVRTEEEADAARADLLPGEGVIMRRLVRPETDNGRT
jgi:hypothetical protein